MKITKVSLFVITLWVLWGIKENLTVLPANFRSNSLPIWLLNATSLATYLILFMISFMLYRLINTYNKIEFFDKISVALLRRIGLSVLAISVLESANRSIVSLLTKSPKTLQEVALEFFWHLIFGSPVFLFCSILIFILADFMKKAITVKAENESFI
jgi:uncharacterized protein with PQ loop repeat